jgi:cytochrome c2
MNPTIKLAATLILLGAAATVSAAPFPDGNAQTGQKLFEQYNCNRCHDQMMGGDGNKIFTRITRKVNSPSGLIDQIGMCSGNVNAHFSPKEKQDFAAYLNIFYKFK